MKIDYLNKNILLIILFVIVIIIILFNYPQFSYNYYLGIIVPIILLLFTGYLLKRGNKFTSGFIGEKDIEVEYSLELSFQHVDLTNIFLIYQRYINFHNLFYPLFQS